MLENEYRNHLLEADLSPNAKLVCLILLHFRNRKTNECFPSQTTITQYCSFGSKNTTIKSLKELEDKGFITIEQKRVSGSKFMSSFYNFGILTNCEPRNDLSDDLSNDQSNDGAQNEPKPIEPIELNKPIIIGDKSPKQKRGIRLPVDWELESELGHWALAQGMTVNEVLKQEEVFKDYWTAAAGKNAVKLDWDATWRNWIRRYIEEKGKRNGKI